METKKLPTCSCEIQPLSRDEAGLLKGGFEDLSIDGTFVLNELTNKKGECGNTNCSTSKNSGEKCTNGNCSCDCHQLTPGGGSIGNMNWLGCDANGTLCLL